MIRCFRSPRLRRDDERGSVAGELETRRQEQSPTHCGADYDVGCTSEVDCRTATHLSCKLKVSTPAVMLKSSYWVPSEREDGCCKGHDCSEVEKRNLTDDAGRCVRIRSTAECKAMLAGLWMLLASCAGTIQTPDVFVPVTLHVYDVGTSSGVQSANGLFNILGTGMYHTAVEIYGLEWSFAASQKESGVFYCQPGRCWMHTYREPIHLGIVKISRHGVTDLLGKMAREWHGTSYDVLRRNCCHFCEAFAFQLGLGPIPSWVMSLANAGATLEDQSRLCFEPQLCCGF